MIRQRPASVQHPVYRLLLKLYPSTLADEGQSGFAAHTAADRERRRKDREGSNDTLPHRRPAVRDASAAESTQSWIEELVHPERLLDDHVIAEPHRGALKDTKSIPDSLDDIEEFTQALHPVHSAPATLQERLSGITTLRSRHRSTSLPGREGAVRARAYGTTHQIRDRRRSRSEPATSDAPGEGHGFSMSIIRSATMGHEQDDDTWSTVVEQSNAPSPLAD